MSEYSLTLEFWIKDIGPGYLFRYSSEDVIFFKDFFVYFSTA